MNDLQSYLQSDELQFGFKRNSSCSHAIFALRSVIDHYCSSGSSVKVCALDISKAFDLVRAAPHVSVRMLLYFTAVIFFYFFISASLISAVS